MIYFYLPEFYYKKPLNSAIIGLLRSNPELFYEDIDVGAVYGCFPGSIWNGGRCIGGTCTKEDMIETIKMYNEGLKVPIRYTFTNCMLEEEDMHDRFCNLQLELATNECGNSVLVNSDTMLNHIREYNATIPDEEQFGIISSTTKRLLDTKDVLTEAFGDVYDIVALDYNFNNQDCLLDYPLVNKSCKFELLLNAYCQDNCPSRARHYKQLYIQQHEFLNNTPEFGACCHISDDFYDVMNTRKSFITREDLYGKYKEAGYRHFKIEGRTNSVYDVLESYLYYMVKPENIDRVRLKTLKAMEQAGRR